MNTTRFWGGGERWHYEAAEYFKSRGYRVTAVVWPESPLSVKMEALGVETFKLKVRSFSYLNPFMIKKLRMHLERNDVDAIVFNGSSDLKLGSKAAFYAGVERIIYRRGLAVKPGNHPVNRRVFGKYLTHLLANSKENEKVMSDLIEYAERKGKSLKKTVIYNAFNTDRMHQRPFRVIDPSQRIIIGTAGRLVHQKGHDLLIEVAEHLAESGIDFEMRIAGEGAKKQKLQKLIERSNVKDRIHFSGFQSDIYAFMKELDVFLLPSRWEGFGQVLAEAMWCGVPIIAFDISSNPELIDDGENGFLVAPFDTRAMADKVEMVVKDQEIQRRFVEAGREKVENNFEKQGQMRKLESFLFDKAQGKEVK